MAVNENELQTSIQQKQKLNVTFQLQNTLLASTRFVVVINRYKRKDKMVGTKRDITPVFNLSLWEHLLSLLIPADNLDNVTIYCKGSIDSDAIWASKGTLCSRLIICITYEDLKRQT